MFDALLTSENWSETFQVIADTFPLACFETLYVTAAATGLSIVIGLPLGILLVTGDASGLRPLPPAFMKAFNLVINLLRSVPFLILMILVFPLTRLIVGTAVGTVASIVPLTIAAFPFVARLAESSLREVDADLIEAAQGMGASTLHIIVRVMVPECIPSLVSQATVAATTILGYSAMSGIVGGGGLGKVAINYGYYRYDYVIMFAAVICLVLFVQIIQSLGTRLAAHLDRS